MIWPLHRIRYNSACFSCRKSQNGTQLFKLCQFITLATGLKEYSSTVANGKYVVPTKQINGVRSTISSDEKTTVLLSETNRILEKTADQLIKSVLPAVKSIIKPLIVTSEQIELPDQTVTIQSDEIPNSTPANIEKSGVSSSILDDEHAEFITEETLPAVKCVTDKTTEKRSKVVAERPIRHSTSTVIDSSPDANMSEKTKETELKRATGSLLFPSGSPSQCRIWFLGNICFIDFDRHFRCGSEKLQCDKKEKVWLSTQKECEMANKRFWRLVVAGPTVPKPIDRKIADSTATINAVGTSASNSDAKLLPIDPAGVQIPHDGTSLPGTSLPSKESIFMRLSNRIRYLELNISLSSQYLNELSRRYRLQQEDNQRLLNRTTKAVEEVWQKVHHEVNFLNKLYRSQFIVCIDF